jgi:two-component system phosphate regulon response regulator OmpR
MNEIAALTDEAPHILVVDDDRRLRELLARFLVGEGLRVTTAAHAADAEAKLKSLVFDLMVLDVMMPGENGFDFARRLRPQNGLPILMLTARSDPGDRVRGLEIGADDYLAKPFEPRELVLRINNILKRASPPPPPVLEFVRFGGFYYRPEKGELRKGEDVVRLTEREREILSILARRAGENVPRDDLAGRDSTANERTIDVQINRLRRKIEDDAANPVHLQTVRGVGYRLAVDP